jgi:hypothetical protein
MRMKEVWTVRGLGEYVAMADLMFKNSGLCVTKRE